MGACTRFPAQDSISDSGPVYIGVLFIGRGRRSTSRSQMVYDARTFDLYSSAPCAPASDLFPR